MNEPRSSFTDRSIDDRLPRVLINLPLMSRLSRSAIRDIADQRGTYVDTSISDNYRHRYLPSLCMISSTKREYAELSRLLKSTKSVHLRTITYSMVRK